MTLKTSSIPCPVGRAFNMGHATCRSCPIECRGRSTGKAPVKGEREQINVHISGNMLVTTARLQGLNTWNNKPRWYYLKERKKWESVLNGVLYVWGRAPGKRILLVKRFVPDKRHLIHDRDNLIGSLKPLKDVLTRYQVLIDDSDEFLDFDILQDIDRTNPRVEVILRDD